MRIRLNRIVRIGRALIGRLCRYKLGRALFGPKGNHHVRVGPLDEATIQYWEDYLRVPPGVVRPPGIGTYLFVAVWEERIVGHVSIHRQWEKTDLCIPGWWLTGLEVDPVWRGRGIGKSLVEQVIRQWEVDNGADTLHLVVKGTNRPAVLLFERAGFVNFACAEWERRLRMVYHKTRNTEWAYHLMKRSPSQG